MADDAIVAQYIVKTDAAVANMAKLAARVEGIEASAKKGASGAENAFSKMSDNVTNQFKALGATIAGAFAVDRIVTFGKEAVVMAGKAEGVRIAFERLGDAKLLQGLRDATKGTISDLNLMTAAVRASNFKIPLEQMGTLLEFARRRAKETGEDINFLVESIVVGIGRKSPLILDNLGISAVELRKRFAGISIESAEVGDVAKIVGAIATEELKKMGDEAVTTGDSIAQMTAAWDNQTVAIGDALVAVLKYYGVLKDNRPDDILRVKQAEELATALARLRLETKGISDEQDRLNKLSDFESQSKQNAISNLNQLVSLEAKRLDLIDKISNADEEADAFRSGASQFKGSAQRAESLREQLDLVEKLAEGERASLGIANDYVKAVKILRAELQKTDEEAPLLIDNLISIGEKVKGLQGELQLLPVFTQKWIDKFNQLDKANIRLQAAQNLVENLKDDLEKPISFAIEPTDEEKDGWASFYQYTQGLAADNEDYMKGLREQRLADALAAMDTEAAAQKQAAETQQQLQSVLIQGFFDSVSLAGQIAGQQQADAIDFEMQMLDDKFKRGEINEKEYEQRQTKIRRKSAQQAKDQATFNAIIGMSSAIVNGLQTQPFVPVGIAMAALAGVLGAAQIVAIQSTPLPTFAQGGWIEGESHAKGGVQLEAEGGEFIINKKSASKYSDLIEAINRDRIDLTPPDGWGGFQNSVNIQNAFTDRNLLTAIDRHREADSNGFDRLAMAVIKAARINNNTRTRWS